MRLMATIFGLAGLAGVSVVSSGQPVKGADGGATRPNVLFVIADQWRAEAFGYAGNPDVRTPAFDRLASESLRFVNAVSTVPVCCPTRASLLTGQRALSHGVFMNDVPLDPAANSIAKSFSANGYDTGFIGKWHVDGHGRSAYIPPERRQGFTYWRALECTHDYNQSAYYAEGEDRRTWQGYDAVAQTQDVLEYLRQHARTNRPFLLFLSWGPPHEPYQTAPERYRAMYDPNLLKLRPNVPPEHQAEARRDLAGYYAHCTALDDCVSRLMNELKAQHLDQNTLVVFTSDHGDMLWSHGSQKKQQPWEESCRVPLLFRLPNRFGTVGKDMPATIGTEDIMPTVLRLCEIATPRSVDGRDFSKYIMGGKDPSDGAAELLCPAPFGQWARSLGGREYRAIRTQRYTYARDLKGPWLLFDNQTDPYQQENLVGRSQFSALQADLEGKLKRKLKATHDRFEPADAYIKRWGYKVDATGTIPILP